MTNEINKTQKTTQLYNKWIGDTDPFRKENMDKIVEFATSDTIGYTHKQLFSRLNKILELPENSLIAIEMRRCSVRNGELSGGGMIFWHQTKDKSILYTTLPGKNNGFYQDNDGVWMLNEFTRLYLGPMSNVTEIVSVFQEDIRARLKKGRSTKTKKIKQ